MRRENSILVSVIVFLLMNMICFAQQQSLHAKAWIKEKEVVLRWAPFTKDVFDAGIKNGYKITRTDNNGNTVVIAEGIKPFAQSDSVWFKLFKTNPRAVIAASVIYDISVSVKDPKKKKEGEATAYSLLLLSCDFDADVAAACGLLFRDKTIDNAKTYSYKITINYSGVGIKSNPFDLKVNTSVISVNPFINDFSGIFKNKNVKLKWKAVLYNNDYSGYFIERSNDSVNFVRLNKSPVILLASQFEKNKEYIYYIDTFPKTKVKYFYRIRGINHFGEISEPSKTLSAIGYEPLNSFPVFDTIYTVNNREVYMKWRMQDKKENELPIEYFVTRAEKDRGSYIPIFKSSSKYEFLDKNPNSTNFYKVGAISYGGDTLFSYSYMALIIDTIPPSIPKGLKAKTDARGNVTITWDKNPEADVRGYKIFRSNALHEEFVQINSEFAIEPVFKDKLNLKTLSKKIYYSVNATDNRFNNSDLSEPVEVKRPDTIAPVAPVINSTKLVQNGIEVGWINSNSEDVLYYVLYRKQENSDTEQKVKEWLAKDSITHFLDTNLVMGTGYKYKIVVSDEDDNVSVSNIPYMRFETGFRKKLTDIKFVVDRKAKTVTLSWEYPYGNIEKFIIYRCKRGGSLTIIKTLGFSEKIFIDKTLSIGNVYEYRIKPVYANGAEGIISDKIEVEY